VFKVTLLKSFTFTYFTQFLLSKMAAQVLD